MSALDVLNNILDEIGIEKDAPELSSETDKDIVEIREFMNLSGQDIVRRADFSNIIANKFLGGDVAQVSMPSNFLRFVSGGNAVKLNKSGVFSSLINVDNDASWQLIKSIPSNNAKYYHVAQGFMKFSPDLDADGAFITYISKNWIDDVDTGKSEINDNGDILLIPEKLVHKGAVWRWLRKKGMPYEDHISEFEADLLTELQSSRGI